MAVWSLVTFWPRWNTEFTINCFPKSCSQGLYVVVVGFFVLSRGSPYTTIFSWQQNFCPVVGISFNLIYILQRATPKRLYMKKLIEIQKSKVIMEWRTATNQLLFISSLSPAALEVCWGFLLCESWQFITAAVKGGNKEWQKLFYSRGNGVSEDLFGKVMALFCLKKIKAPTTFTTTNVQCANSHNGFGGTRRLLFLIVFCCSENIHLFFVGGPGPVKKGRENSNVTAVWNVVWNWAS